MKGRHHKYLVAYIFFLVKHMPGLPIPCRSVQQMAGKFVDPAEEGEETSKEQELSRLI